MTNRARNIIDGTLVGGMMALVSAATQLCRASDGMMQTVLTTGLLVVSLIAVGALVGLVVLGLLKTLINQVFVSV